MHIIGMLRYLYLCLLVVLLIPFNSFGQEDCYAFNTTYKVARKVKADKWIASLDGGLGMVIGPQPDGFSNAFASLSASVKYNKDFKWSMNQDWLLQQRGLDGDWDFVNRSISVSFVAIGVAREYKVSNSLFLSSGVSVGGAEERTSNLPVIGIVRVKKQFSDTGYMRFNLFIMSSDANSNSTTQFAGLSLGWTI